MPYRASGEGHISYHKPTKRWRAILSLGPKEGKRRRKYLYGVTRKEVAEKLRSMRQDVELGVDVTHRSTVAEYLDSWLDTVIKQQRRPRTYESYRQIVRLYIVPYIGRVQLIKLTPMQVQNMLNIVQRSGGVDQRPVSPRTVQRTRAVLRSALTRAQRWGIVVRNVAALTDPPRVEKFKPMVLTIEQGQRFLKAVAEHRLEALWVMALLMGMREGELLGLGLDNIDLTKHNLTVCQTLQRQKDVGLVLAPPKTTTSTRTLPVPDIVEQALQRHFKRREAERERAANFWVETGLVFTTEGGQPIDPANLLKTFKRVLVAADLPKMRFHDLRHSCATLLIAQAVHPRIVMDILGHSQISITMDLYSHVLPETQREAANAMDALFSEQVVKQSK
jgi:integrase